METNYLREILSEYNETRNTNMRNAQFKKQEFYKKYPELERLEKQVNLLSLEYMQSKLASKSDEDLKKLDKKIKDARKERDAFYKAHNINSSTFDIEYNCPLCEDTGFVKNKDGSSSYCKCIKQRLYNMQCQNSNLHNLQKENFDNFDASLYSDIVDNDKYGKDISPRDNILNIKNQCMKFVEDFDNPEQKNLLFIGGTGRGKTFMSSCIANELILRNKTVLYQSAPIMLDAIIDYKFGKTKVNIIDSIYNADFLIIDDLGTEASNNIKSEELLKVLNVRLLNKEGKVLKTLISTNLSMKELFKEYDERLFSRIVGHYSPYLFIGDDIRLTKLSRTN